MIINKKGDALIMVIVIHNHAVVVQARGDKNSTQKEQKIELHVLNSPGNLAGALCAFDVS